MLADIPVKKKLMVEYPINASPKILFPYLNTAAGLQRWFCDRVEALQATRFNFVWDRENHVADLTVQRPNKTVRFVFLNEQAQPATDADYLEFALETSALTDEVFLRVTEYSAVADQPEHGELWEGLVGKLREQVGG